MTDKLVKAFTKGEFPRGAGNKEVIGYLGKLLHMYHRELIRLMGIAAKYERLFYRYRDKYKKKITQIKKEVNGLYKIQ